MQQIDSELLGQRRYEELLQEAEQARLAHRIEQQSAYQSMLYLIGSSLIQLGRRLERVGTSRMAHPSTPATVTSHK